MQIAMMERKANHSFLATGGGCKPRNELPWSHSGADRETGTFVRVKATEMSVFRQIRVVPRESSPAPVFYRGGFLCGIIDLQEETIT